MTRWSAARTNDEGAYAILYALLVVVLLAFGALVVDISAVRQDRRLNRSATDAAALGGARYLLPTGTVDPFAACNSAWAYLTVALKLTGVPNNKCSNFSGLDVPTLCAASPTSEIDQDVTIGSRTIRIAWPIPSTGGSGFLNAEIAPGRIDQPFDSSLAATDGTPGGCDRIGVAIFQDQKFGLAGAFGATGTNTQVHSVALAQAKPGDNPQIAALNVLNLTVCKALDTGGQGDVLVNRGIDSSDPSGTKFSPGIIAVESDGSGCGNAASDYVMAVSNNGNNRVCASGASQVPDALGTCDGKGLILQHAMDPGGRRAYAGVPGTPTVPISPAPQPEFVVSRWKPVTDAYGCSALPTITQPPVNCATQNPNYMRTMLTAYGSGAVAPTTVYTGVGTYTGLPLGPFKTLPDPLLVPGFTCSPSNVYVPPGNWFINCPDSGNKAGFSLNGNGSVVVFGGGHVVFQGGLDVAKTNACFAFNVPLSASPAAGSVTCPTVVNAQSSVATTSPPPTQEAILVSRGTQPISNGASSVTVLMPQTLVVQSNGGALYLGGGTGTVLWSAPGAGARLSGVSTLGALCSSDPDCMKSHFDKIAYWNESTAGDTIGGQGSITYVGVYFAPRAQFTFAGQGGGAGTNAQFWADTLTLSGLAKLHLTPDAAVGVPRPVFSFSLIR